MKEAHHTLRLDIEGRWNVHEFGCLLVSVSDLYNLRMLVMLSSQKRTEPQEHLLDALRRLSLAKTEMEINISEQEILAPYVWGGGIPLKSSELARVANNILHEDILTVRKITYSSPGSADLAGIGIALGHIKDMIFRLLDWKKNHIENKISEAKLQKIRLENAKQLVDIAKDCGFSSSELRQMISFADDRQEVFIRPIENGKIKSVTLLQD